MMRLAHALMGPNQEVAKPYSGLKTFLLEDIPNARVLTYGYNADVVGGLFQANNKNSISQHSQDLKAKLERELENDVFRLVNQ